MAEESPAYVNRRRKDDPGHIVTLFLKQDLLEDLRRLRTDADDLTWNMLAEEIAAALMISPIDVVIWDLLEGNDSLEISIPARAEHQLYKFLLPQPCESLRKIGIIGAEFGEQNNAVEALDNLREEFGRSDSELVCIYLSDRSMAHFLPHRKARLALIGGAMYNERQAPASATDKYRLLRCVPYKHGIRLILLVEQEAHRRLCTALADNYRSVASTGVIRAVVRGVKAVALGMNDVKKENDVKKSRDPDKPLPTPDKPDQEHETWLSWVHLKRKRGIHRGPSIYLVRGKDKGKAAWHYVHVNDSLLSEFLEKTRGGSLDVADYGEVLASGWGEDPPQDLADSIDRDYA